MSFFNALFRKQKRASPEDPAHVTHPRRPLKPVFVFVTEKTPSGKREVLDFIRAKKGKASVFSKALQRSYQLDSSKYALEGLVDVQISDKDYFEPLDKGTPDLLGLEPHYSQRADNIIRLEFVRQAVGTLKGMASSFDWKIALILVVVGYFVGSSMPLSKFGA